ncbi:telomeric repeat-binding factor 1 isoform X2 [Nycticebus coucang]|uniref:telomeric repeat-binding factor 1 isoform X2 n=1 Tax=Nycticebus coucang TaxID=9470 RepID=UPI00234C8DBA|nr:telomeric repeat-binding factor 1 isoform X2 [Nycticebus coucang]
MAEDAASGAPSPRGCADGSDADPPDERVAEMEGEDQEQFECQELLDCQVQLGTPEEREDVGLMAEAEAVAAGWMLDFLCLSLCRAFRDGRSEDFQRTRNSAEDAQFESDERITPLESALMIWDSVEKEHDKLHEEIQNLIKIQAIGVCMENANFKEAEEVFERIFDDPNSYTPLQRKLRMIISRKDTFHSIFQHFSFNHMMEKIKTYVNDVLNEKSSAFLMKAAAKVVESKRTRTITSEDKPNGNDTENESEANLDRGKSVNDKQSTVTESSGGTLSLSRSHKNLFLSNLKYGSQQQDLNKKKERVGTLQCKRKIRERRATESRISRVSKSQAVTPEKHQSRKKQAWLWEEDKNLRSGVKKYGEGKWSKILLHYKFKNRTGVMLKDRWRTMKKLKLISSDSED